MSPTANNSSSPEVTFSSARVSLPFCVLLAVIPLVCWLAEKPELALVTGFLSFVGCISLLVALKRDPKRTILRGFSQTRTARAGLLIACGLVTYVAICDARAGLVTLMLASVFCWLCWAGSDSVGALKERVGKILLLGSALPVCLVMGEATVWLSEMGRPRNDEHWTWGHPVQLNRLGFRERDFDSFKRPNTYRLMVLGDSLTWGTGLADDERYTNQLERLLYGSHHEQRVEVLNFGVPGDATVAQRDILAKYVDQVDPDQIVIGFCINDPQIADQNYAQELERYRLLFRGFKFAHRLGASRLAWLCRTNADQLLRNVNLVPDNDTALARVYEPDSEPWRQFVLALRDIKQISDRRGLPTPIFVPLLSGSGDFSRPNEHLRYTMKWSRQALRAAKSQGFYTVNMESDFKTQGDRDRHVNQWDGHPSAECHEIYARKIAIAALDNMKKGSMR